MTNKDLDTLDIGDIVRVNKERACSSHFNKNELIKIIYKDNSSIRAISEKNGKWWLMAEDIEKHSPTIIGDLLRWIRKLFNK